MTMSCVCPLMNIAQECERVMRYLLGVWASLLFEDAGAVGVMLLPIACFGPVVAVLLTE